MNTQEIEQRLQRLEAAEAIRTLKSHYLFCCDRKDPAGMRACFADGPVDIDFGIIGRFDRADALVEVYRQAACHDHMVEMHHGANPQIEVTDAAHARATWSLQYQLVDTQAHRLTQLGGYYEDAYRKDGDAWKITASRFNVTSTLVLELGADALRTTFAGRTMPMPA